MLTKQEKVAELKQWLTKTELDPVVTGQTLGFPAANVSPEVLLRASKKLIQINRQEVEPDNRDDLRYMKFLGLEDFVKEHIEKDAGGVQMKAMGRIRHKKDLSWLQPGFFSPQIRSIFIGGNKHSETIDGHNPIDNYDKSHKVTKLGEGGIPSIEAVPDESRNVNSSIFGFLDPFRVSETNKVGVDHRFSHNVVKGRDGKLYRLMLDNNRKPVWVDHETILNSRVHIPEH